MELCTKATMSGDSETRGGGMGPPSRKDPLRVEGRTDCQIFTMFPGGGDNLGKLAPSLAGEARAAPLDDNRVRRVGPPTILISISSSMMRHGPQRSSVPTTSVRRSSRSIRTMARCRLHSPQAIRPVLG